MCSRPPPLDNTNNHTMRSIAIHHGQPLTTLSFQPPPAATAIPCLPAFASPLIPHPRLLPGQDRPTSVWRSVLASLLPDRAPFGRPDCASLLSPRRAVAAHPMQGRAELLRCTSYAMLSIDDGVYLSLPHWRWLPAQSGGTCGAAAPAPPAPPTTSLQSPSQPSLTPCIPED